MVLCEIMEQSSLGFLETWLLLTVIAMASLTLTSGLPFWYYYVHPTYEKWLQKTNKHYPSPALVRSEAYKSLKGTIFVTLSPTLALWLTKQGYGQAYCGFKFGWQYEVLQFVVVFFMTDFLEWGWHFMGHKFDVLWNIHRPHHRYHNPTPWAVIADDAPDEIMRGSPLFLFPMLAPVNIEMLFFQFAMFFNIYGTMIHCGIDWSFIPIHGQRILNTPYHHHIHHRLSVKKKPLHTGFFLQIWDRFMDSVHKGECYCSECDAARGNRTREAYDKIVKPDYSCLWTLAYWTNWRDDVDESKQED